MEGTQTRKAYLVVTITPATIYPAQTLYIVIEVGNATHTLGLSPLSKRIIVLVHVIVQYTSLVLSGLNNCA